MTPRNTHNLHSRECRLCVNSTANPSVRLDATGLCGTCASYRKHFDPAVLQKEFEWLLSMRRGGAYDAMVGISGGKDSTAALVKVKELGFRPLSFTFDIGYYPRHIFARAKKVASHLGVDHALIDIRKYIRPCDRISFEETAALYDQPVSGELAARFRAAYTEGRKHYSVNCEHSLPHVRTCQLCRKIVIRAYYAEARARDISLIILGMNEWAALSQDVGSDSATFSAIRKLQPVKDEPPVYVVHLPFLLQHTKADTEKGAAAIAWKAPRGEDFIESNANSCLFARAAESKANNLLGFHPDATRLSREVTVGFITKAQAKKALAKTHRSPKSVRQVLEDAGIL